MIVKIHDIAALCVACGGGEFESLSAQRLGPGSLLKCSGCGARYSYVQLIDQIGEQAMRQANTALDEQQKKPRGDKTS
jgi:hypothetical protein